jgi:hypothetical protein
MSHNSQYGSIDKARLGRYGVMIGVYAVLTVLSFLYAWLRQTVWACPTGVTYPGTEAYTSTITLQMPFIAGQVWTVGGTGSFYGNGEHCNSLNDYYATDWNRTSGGCMTEGTFNESPRFSGPVC